MKPFQFGALVVLGTLPLFALGCGSSNSPTIASQAEAADAKPIPGKVAASYNSEGELFRPADHREWVFVGAPVTPNDMNDGKAAFPEFLVLRFECGQGDGVGAEQVVGWYFEVSLAAEVHAWRGQDVELLHGGEAAGAAEI